MKNSLAQQVNAWHLFSDKLVARRAKYDKMGEGNMPITTKQILDLLKYNFGRTSKFRGSGFTLIGEGPSQNAYGLSELVGKDYSSGSSGKLVQKEKGDGNSSG